MRSMAAVRNPLDVHTLLPRTNCGECGARSCLAFAAALMNDGRGLRDCPHLAPEAAAALAAYIQARRPVWHGQVEELRRLKAGVAALDLPSSAGRLGADLAGDRLSVKCLGKDFLIGRDGEIASDCHTHAGLAIPLLRYVLYSRGGVPTGVWVPFRELGRAAGRAPLFEQLCERPLRRLVDTHGGLLADLIDLFAGERSVNLFGSDVSLVLYPLPRIPVLVCWWEPDDGLESSLHIFFDETAGSHLDVEWIHGLCVGLVEMFGKIVQRHA